MSNTDEYLEDFYKDQYESEHGRADTLDRLVNVPILIVSVFLGASALHIEHWPEWRRDGLVVAYYIVTGLFFAGVFFSIVFLVRSYTNYKYAYIPSTSRVAGRIRELRDFYRNYYGGNSEAVEEDVKREIKGEILQFYMEAAAENRKNNADRASWMHWMIQAIIVSLVLLVASRGLLFLIDEPKPQRFVIVESPAAANNATEDAASTSGTTPSFKHPTKGALGPMSNDNATKPGPSSPPPSKPAPPVNAPATPPSAAPSPPPSGLSLERYSRTDKYPSEFRAWIPPDKS